MKSCPTAFCLQHICLALEISPDFFVRILAVCWLKNWFFLFRCFVLAVGTSLMGWWVERWVCAVHITLSGGNSYKNVCKDLHNSQGLPNDLYRDIDQMFIYSEKNVSIYLSTCLPTYLPTYLSNSIYKCECIGTMNILVQPLNPSFLQDLVAHPGRERIPDKVAYHRAMSSCGAAMMWTLAVHLLATMHLDGGLGCWGNGWKWGHFFQDARKIDGANLEKWLFLPCVLIWKHTNWYNQIEFVKHVCGKNSWLFQGPEVLPGSWWPLVLVHPR